PLLRPSSSAPALLITQQGTSPSSTHTTSRLVTALEGESSTAMSDVEDETEMESDVDESSTQAGDRKSIKIEELQALLLLIVDDVLTWLDILEIDAELVGS